MFSGCYTPDTGFTGTGDVTATLPWQDGVTDQFKITLQVTEKGSPPTAGRPVLRSARSSPGRAR